MKRISQNSSERLKIKEREIIMCQRKIIKGLSYEDTKENGEAALKNKQTNKQNPRLRFFKNKYRHGSLDKKL